MFYEFSVTLEIYSQTEVTIFWLPFITAPLW